MLKLYYHPMSFPSLGPLFTAEATNQSYEKELVDLQTGAHKAPEYLAVNPYGRVPGLKDGDFSMGESGAIMRYLARGSALYPNDARQQAKIDQWSDFAVHHVRTNVARVQFNRVIAPMMGADVDESSIALGLKFLGDNLPHVEHRLSESSFLAGDTMTLADISLIAALEPENTAQLDLSPYPNLQKWLAARRSESFYTNVHSHFGAEMGM